MDLYNAIPDLKPTSRKLLEPIEFGWSRKPPYQQIPLTGHFRIVDMPHLLALPKFDWEILYHAPEVLEHGVQGAIERSRETGGELQTVEPTFVPHVPNTVTLREIDGPWT